MLTYNRSAQINGADFVVLCNWNRKFTIEIRTEKMLYQKNTENDKQLLVDCHLKGDDYMELARVLSIKRKTAYSIAARFLATGFVVCRHGGNRRLKVTDEIRRTSVDIIEENPEFILEQLNEELRRRPPDAAHISISTLSTILNGELIAIKKLEDSPTERNTERVKNQRRI